MEELKKIGAEDILVIAGGHIPREDIPLLMEMGIAKVFPPGSSLNSIVNFIKENLNPKSVKEDVNPSL
jgi:methylmalonyl-CoA mutase C-terminal domain/subunit